jgi:D-amino peptidase
MRKLYISADIEGVCGIAHWDETELASPQSAAFRAQMTREVRAACEAATSLGVAEILVKDAHDSGRNLDPAALPRNVSVLRNWTRGPHVMVAGAEAGFDAAMFIGYHSGAGADGNPLAHTMSTSVVRLWVNGEPASEFLLNAYTLASLGVPVVLVTGDRQLCDRVEALNPRIRTVAVNQGVGGATLAIHPDLAVERIQAAAAEALRSDPADCALTLPDRFELAVQFRGHDQAYRASFYPGAERTGPDTVAFASAVWADALTFLFFVL